MIPGFILMYKGTEVGRRMYGVATIVGPLLSPFIQDVKFICERLLKIAIMIKIKYTSPIKSMPPVGKK